MRGIKGINVQTFKQLVMIIELTTSIATFFIKTNKNLLSSQLNNLLKLNIIKILFTCMKSLIVQCVASSSKLISLENRFIILPSGFKSKKRIGVDITALNISACILVDEFMHILQKIISSLKIVVNIPMNRMASKIKVNN